METMMISFRLFITTLIIAFCLITHNNGNVFAMECKSIKDTTDKEKQHRIARQESVKAARKQARLSLLNKNRDLKNDQGEDQIEEGIESRPISELSNEQMQDLLEEADWTFFPLLTPAKSIHHFSSFIQTNFSNMQASDAKQIIKTLALLNKKSLFRGKDNFEEILRRFNTDDTLFLYKSNLNEITNFLIRNNAREIIPDSINMLICFHMYAPEVPFAKKSRAINIIKTWAIKIDQQEDTDILTPLMSTIEIEEEDIAESLTESLIIE